MSKFTKWYQSRFTMTSAKQLIKDFTVGVLVALVFLALISVIGCDTAPKVVTKTDVKLVKTPRYLLEKCPVSAPPAKAIYLAARPQEKEDLLSTYITTLLGNLKVCNDQITSIKTFQEKEEKNILMNMEKKQ